MQTKLNRQFLKSEQLDVIVSTYSIEFQFSVAFHTAHIVVMSISCLYNMCVRTRSLDLGRIYSAVCSDERQSRYLLSETYRDIREINNERY